MSTEEKNENAEKNWTVGTRTYVNKFWPYNRLLPGDEPIYVARFWYSFGALTVAAFILLIITGIILVIQGPQQWHSSSMGRFWDSTHFWSVQIFMLGMIVHALAGFWTAAWRKGRWITWMLGVFATWVALITALSGYLLQTNFDSQWIATSAKDAFLSVGFGQIFNTMNLDQVLPWHVVLLPLLVTIVLAVHILWVRRHGVVEPFGAEDDIDEEASA
jgi:ubiquinol-cytochrome c reductase cytochrome b subunit